jgi:hypothetical protein
MIDSSRTEHSPTAPRIAGAAPRIAGAAPRIAGAAPRPRRVAYRALVALSVLLAAFTANAAEPAPPIPIPDPTPPLTPPAEPAAPVTPSEEPAAPVTPSEEPASPATAPSVTPPTADTISATAETPRFDKMSDGVYGRFDGDLDLSLAAGATFDSTGSTGAAIARVVFMQSAGLYVAYTDAFGRSEAAVPRSFATGVTLRPLFIPRWAFDLERGPAILDLTIDSLAFELGALWAADKTGSHSERPGLEAALGFEVPLFKNVNGPFLGARGALRWRAAELAGDDRSPLKPVLFATFAWHGLVDAHVVDAGDRRLH